MSYCVIPGCFNPPNQDSALFCHSCGSKLLLKERYRPLKPIGYGGFGRTFLAVDENMPSQPHCVIKQLFLQTQNGLVLKKAVQMFHQEAEHLEQLGQHQQIPTLLAHFEQNRQLYLVQEWIEGETLEQELQQVGVFSETQIGELLQGLLPVLQFIHDRQVIHRDIKPSNIIRRQSDRLPVLIDFGVAKLISGTALLHTGTVVGTAEYTAPEQSKGKALPASDLYSLGVTCIHLLTNTPPRDLFDIIDNRWAWREHLPGNTRLSDRLAQILDQLSETTLRKRYQSADDALQAVVKLSPILKRGISPLAGTNFSVNHWQRTAAKSEAENWTSAVGVDYQYLQNFLATGKWQQADEETRRVMCQALGKPLSSYLHSGEISQLPCKDLWIIDQLWLKYSQGRFGFTVQKQIYENTAGEEYWIFCDCVGWPTHQPHFLDAVMMFSWQAPVGHLPSRRWAGGFSWWRHATAMAEKLKQCGIG